MNVTTYVLQHPMLLANLFIEQLPAVSLFFGVTHVVLRKATRIKTRWLLAFAYWLAPAALLALSGWSVKAKGYDEGIKILVPLIFSMLSCAVLFYHEWRRQRNDNSRSEAVSMAPLPFRGDPQTKPAEAEIKPPSGSANTPSLAISTQSQVISTELKLDTAATKFQIDEPRLADKQTPTISNTKVSGWTAHWGAIMSVAFLVALVIYRAVGSNPHYIVEDGGEYGYIDAKKGAAYQAVKLFRYAGIHNDKHQVYVENKDGTIEYALECAAPCKAIKVLQYGFYAKYLTPPGGKKFIQADDDSVEAQVMEDAINGHLKLRALDLAALQLYRVKMDQGMDGVSIRPLFMDDGVAFEYMGEAPHREAKASSE